ncbi:hypothetical protein WICMUC_000523 [Wickerhamomyces mucosus]|uniref:cysteine--tRNA ligase n=1 Tax=Wickerhamomyces mucosus TaxID=1378264 RepID=A0A9P8PXR4_9ASCO|nr:hypothetical protein WICMUC_000523 [Wickerhamomyces mucosus]
MSTTAKSKVTQPHWHNPVEKQSTAENGTPILKFYNTLTRSKNEFKPISGREIKWYSCGPTVYDYSHMGHARNYVTIDINRRILQNYFNYDVNFVQNVTDIDDKIIIRARHNYLYQQFQKELEKEPLIPDSIVTKVSSAWEAFITKNLPEAPVSHEAFAKWSSTVNISEKRIEQPKFEMYLNSAKSGYESLKNKDVFSKAEFLSKAKDVLVPVLDEERGSTVNDPEIFRSLPAYWEHKFNQDMAALNVLPPDSTTRVSEYVPEIVQFIEKIISNGFAYPTADGSVYFDTVAFDNSKLHEYAKLQPWNKGQADLIAEGEGSLNSNPSGKRSPNDFALWKASKPGEPEWQSPWGRGRPGWHIECSVMASDVLGDQIDIHSGGIDLAFPHHDNELAQSEACFDNQQWINYFLHTGHLHIEGQKMSKSLKNFITIEEALEKYSARQLRLAFASAQWNNNLDFKESLITEVRAFESTLNNFFHSVRALNNDYKHQLESNIIVSKKVGPAEKKLINNLFETKAQVHAAFSDNLSTPQAIKSILSLVSSTRLYISDVGTDVRIESLVQVTTWITKILDILGFSSRSDQLGWAEESTDTSSSTEEAILPYVKTLSSYRDQIRQAAIKKAPYSEFLIASDKIRDHELLNLGVSLDDRADGQPAIYKILGQREKEELINLQKVKEQKEEEKKIKKLEQQKLNEQREKERLKKAKISPDQLFKTSEYSEWDEAGFPIKDKEGVEVTKSARKKLQKLYDQQKKLHEEYLKTIS